MRKTIGEKFYPNIKWEEIIPANATRQEIKNILTELNDKSKFFARTSFNENNYGKNIQWAHEMSLISKSAEYRIRNGESFENVIDDIARNYRDYDEATTLDSNIEISDRRLYSGVYRGNNPPQLEAFGYVTPFGKTDMYEEYFDRFMSKFDKPRQNPYPDMQLTELKKLEQGFDDFSFTIDVMSHPPNQTINAGMKHIAEKFEELKPLFEKVRNGGKLSAAEKQLADEKISEMYFLMANIMPWAKGTNGISDIFMRSTYNALNINQPALKQGVSLDLESFYTELDEYKAKWNTFFEEE